MNFQDKIDEIRQKPEHIRMRYVWGCSLFFTALVVAVWFLSLAVQEKDSSLPVIGENQTELLEELGGQKKSLEDAASQMKGTLEGVRSGENLNNDRNSFQKEGFSE